MVEERRHNDFVTLKEYFQAKFDAVEQARELADKAIQTKFDASEQARELALSAMNIRLASMNEFREQIKDQTANFITKREHDIVLGEIQSLRESRAEMKGKADQGSVNWVMFVATVGIIISIAGLFMTWTRLTRIEDVSYGYGDYLKAKNPAPVK